ncbi:MAG TPA: prephenate dehydratase [Bacillota bacterium]|nr:prephenate dehydratase [Bacillota bacterium]
MEARMDEIKRRINKDKGGPKNLARGKISPDSIIGYYGSPGSYSQEAAISHFGQGFKLQSCASFEQVVSKVLSHEIDIGVLPVENSSTGIIAAVMDLIRDNRVYITGEHTTRICHHLLALPGTRLEDIKTIYSHQQGLEQSSHFLKQHAWEHIAYKSTASSAKLISSLADKTKAAIASESCAHLYGLEVLVPNIHYNKNNYTRFITIGRDLIVGEHCDKISIAMDIAHKPGALYSVMGLFNKRGLNLMKIESRPIIGKPWQYLFFFDLEGNLEDSEVKDLLKCLEDGGHDFRVLGNYRANKASSYDCI